MKRLSLLFAVVAVLCLLAAPSANAQIYCEECGGGGCYFLDFTTDAPATPVDSSIRLEVVQADCSEITLKLILRGDFPEPVFDTEGVSDVIFHYNFDDDLILWSGWTPGEFLDPGPDPGTCSHFSICAPRQADPGDVACGHSLTPNSCENVIAASDDMVVATYRWDRAGTPTGCTSLDFDKESLRNKNGKKIPDLTWYNGDICVFGTAP